MPRQNENLANAGHYLGNILAAQYETVRVLIRERVTRIDGFAAGGERVGGSKSEVSDPTLRAALQRANLEQIYGDLQRGHDDLLATVKLFDKQIRESLQHAGHIPEQTEQPLCRDGQVGRDGVLEWGDPLCCRLPVKGQLCQAHYSKWRRFRTDKGIDTTKDFAA